MEKYKETPKSCSYFDHEYSKLIIEIELAWINKKDISLLINDGGIYLFASSEDADYYAMFPFICPVRKEEATARYLQEGLLVIEVPLMESMKDAMEITLEKGEDDEDD